MKFQRHTASLCNVCYQEIPAVVEMENGAPVMLRKKCPQHGAQSGVLEPDPTFYTMLAGLGSRGIYSGYFVDVTRRCNLRCETCFFPLEKADPKDMFTVEAILSECRLGARFGPIILTGGEPTEHAQLPTLLTEIRKFCGVELLSNGVKLAEKAYFDEIMPLIGGRQQRGEFVSSLNLSIHHKESQKWREVIEHCRKEQKRIESALIVVTSQESFRQAMAIAEEIQDVVQTFRIKAASRLWNEQKPPGSGEGEDDGKIYVSTMWNWLEDLGYRVKLMTEAMNNKSCFVNVAAMSAAAERPMLLMLVAWHDIGNVDLADIDCGPYYRARNGEVRNLVVTNLINEGMAKGWVKGTHLGDLMEGAARKPDPTPRPKVFARSSAEGMTV